MLNENSTNVSEATKNLNLHIAEQPLTRAGYLATGVYLCFVGKFNL